MIGPIWPLFGRTTTVDIGAWVRDHYQAVYSFCRRRVGADLAEDVTQETFMVAQRRIGSYRPEVAPRTFLIGIAVRLASNALRKRKPEATLDWLEESSPHDPTAQWIDSVVLQKALSRLTDEHRLVVQLHEFEGFSYDEIAEILQIPAGTVKSRLHHAFLKLRALLQDSEVIR